LQGPEKNDKYRRIKECKIATPVDILIRGFPNMLADYISYVKALRFDETPDYDYLRSIFQDILQQEGLANDSTYDWN
jgi:hypothetical protein